VSLWPSSEEWNVKITTTTTMTNLIYELLYSAFNEKNSYWLHLYGCLKEGLK